ncbi:MAG: hypothetical protein QW781_04430 [Methanothrix sp.]|uniref:COG1361 S-layer family protein n=1 Tax=Methanothrix sp. TaxID=90426 RepID=UPI0031691CC5|nr:hypothetical protein [Methanothrix sp.]
MRYELIMLLILVAPAMGQSNYIPPVIEGENYWNMYGSPNLTAAISGTNEFDRGDTVTLYIDLINYGRFMSFEKDKTAYTPMEMALAAKEQELEQAKTTAIGIVATLVSESDQIEVKSGDQVVESLKSGDKTKNPLKFTVKIAKHAPAGVYPLRLNLKYDYQYNVQVDANKFDSATNNLIGFRAAYWYQKANQTVVVPIIVKKKADFEITDVRGVLRAGAKKEELQVTYRNIGEEGVSDAIARLSIFKPFSSTDDQAYIGNLGPGEEATVVFRLDVDSDATPKEYGINSEIKYTDVRGDTVISESMKIPVRVEPASRSMMLPALAVLVVLGGAGAYIYRRRSNRS